MTLSTLAILIGAVYCAIQVFALLQPATFTRHARAFPRSEGIGFVLMGIGTIWFLYNLQSEAIADFAAYKKYMLIAFGAIGVLTSIFVRDFLAVRGLAVCLLLLAWFTLNRTRWEDSSARLILVVWAYLWVICGMWFSISPWRLRDILNWWTANSSRLKLGSVLQLALGATVLVLGLTAFRH
ncbi:MAG: hypothetical protein ACXW3Z_03585 [Limisphaerales bacterium]